MYSLALLPTGDLASTGEDRTLRIWKGEPFSFILSISLYVTLTCTRSDGECAQTITHPAISVWAVSVMPNGDIVTGASDGFIRVFSAAEERWASVEDLKAYEDLVANSALPAQQVGDVKKDELPGEEALLQPGA